MSAEAGLKGVPIPTRFDEAEDTLIREINRATGLPMAEIVRRAARFALHRFRTGEINILTLETNAQRELPLPSHPGNGRDNGR